MAGSIFYLTRPANISDNSYPTNQLGNNVNSVNAPAPATTGQTLDVSGQNLTTLTAEFFNNNPGVVTLDVSNNKLTGALPAEIRKMSGLKIVRASRNQLTGIPAEIGQLGQLQELDFSYNQINTYPNELANLKNNLKVLKLTGNTFTPDQIGALRALLPNTEVVF